MQEMKRLPEDVVQFLHNQGFVIVSTIDNDGGTHNACKGIVDIKRSGRVYLLDLYHGNTYANIKRNPRITITAVDEHKFRGYSLKGKALTMHEEGLDTHFIKAWEDRITSRLTQRVLKNLRDEKGHTKHPEVLLPSPKYMIAMEVEEIVNLTPHQFKEEV